MVVVSDSAGEGDDEPTSVGAISEVIPDVFPGGAVVVAEGAAGSDGVRVTVTVAVGVGASVVVGATVAVGAEVFVGAGAVDVGSADVGLMEGRSLVLIVGRSETAGVRVGENVTERLGVGRSPPTFASLPQAHIVVVSDIATRAMTHERDPACTMRT